jgi:hypothetical protein
MDSCAQCVNSRFLTGQPLTMAYRNPLHFIKMLVKDVADGARPPAWAQQCPFIFETEIFAS